MENNRCYGCMEEKKNHPICEHCGFDERQQNMPHQLPMGTILRGQYLIGRALGQGGSDITYLGWDLYLDKAVAIKEFYPGSIVTRDTAVSMSVTSYTAGADLYERNKEQFVHEAQAMAKFEDLQHIVKIYSFFPENNTAYLVMEYARGRTLQQLLKSQGPMSLTAALEILEPIIEDLQKVHEGGVIHRDISPDNIMLLDQGGAKLLDFCEVRQKENPDQESQLSKSTETILKQGFAPIEQYNARASLGPWTDVYAMCATICYCLNGKLPQTAPDRTIDEEPEHFIDILPVPEAQKSVLRRGMAVRPQDRIASMNELLRQLKEALGEKPRPPVSRPQEPDAIHTVSRKLDPEKKTPPKPAAQKKKPLWLIAVAVLAVAVMFAVPFFQPTPTANEKSTNPKDLILENYDPEGISEYAFGTDIQKSEVISIEFRDSLESAPTGAVDVSESRNGSVLLWAEPDSDGFQSVYIAGNGKVIFPSDCRRLFGGQTGSKCYSSVRNIYFNDAIDTGNVTDMSWMFSGCNNLQSLNLSGYKTSKVNNMSWMFYECQSLRTLDVSGFNTSAVKNMSGMFYNCRQLSYVDLGNFETAYVTDMSAMFCYCQGLLRLDLSRFDTLKVTSMEYMFTECTSLVFLDLSGFEISDITSMQEIFYRCDSLTGAGLKTNNNTLRKEFRLHNS